MHFYQGHLYHFAQLDSTQRYLLDHPQSALPVLCIADTQSAGVGQRGRPWQSPPGQLYMSLAVNLPGEAALHQGIAQMLALTIAETLDEKAQTLRLKWPNDIYANGRKCAGILVDSQPHGDSTRIIAGIGINLTRPPASPAEQGYLNEHFPARTPHTLLASLLPALLAGLERWADKPYLPIEHRWTDYDLCYQQRATLEGEDGHHTLYGIDQKGRLIAKSADGKLHFLTRTRIAWPTSS